MKTLRIVVFLFIYAAITFLWLLYDRRNIFDRHTAKEVIQLPAIWALPILMLIVALLFSKLYSYLKKTKNNNFIWGQLTCLVCVFLLFIYTFISDWQHDKKYGNFESNRANRYNTFFLADTAYQIKAYNALESNFADKNSFRITDLFSDNKDTIINSIPTKMHISWFEYYLNKNQKIFFCAKYVILNDTIITVYLNDDAKKNLDFKKRKAYKDSLLKFVDSIND